MIRRSLRLAAMAVAGTIALAFVVTHVSAATTTVAVGDIWFCESSFQGGVCPTTIQVGDTVTWDFSGAYLPHTATDCGASCDNPTASPAFDSGAVSGGGEPYSYTFTEAGTYNYYCDIHPDGMRGQIVVEGGAEPTALTTPSPDGAPVTNTPGDGGTTATPVPGGVPPTGSGPDGGGSTAGWWLAGLVAAAGVCLAGAGLAVRRGH